MNDLTALRTEMLNNIYDKQIMSEIANNLINNIPWSEVISISDTSKHITISMKNKKCELVNLYPIIASELRDTTAKNINRLSPASKDIYFHSTINDFYAFFNATLSKLSATKKILTIYL